MVNRVTLIGNLGKDPEVKRLDTGAMVAKFSMATSEHYQDKEGNWKEETEWHNVIVWRSLAERAEASLKKGHTIYLEGKLKTRKWEDQNGVSHWTTDVVASYFRIIKKAAGQTDSFPSADDERNYQRVPAADGVEVAVGPNQPEGADDDLPF